MRLNQHYLLLGGLLFVAVLARLFMHIPNMVPTLAIAVVFLRQLVWPKAVLSLLFVQLFSDILLSPQTGFSAFGTWSLFTYTGYLGLLGFALWQRSDWSLKQTFLFAAPMSVAYWAWTNFGTWLASGMYQHSLAGLGQCFVMGLPFLRNAFVADMLWVALLVAMTKGLERMNAGATVEA